MHLLLLLAPSATATTEKLVKHAAAAEPAATAAALAVLIESLFAVLVVDLPLVVVGQHLVRFGNRLELGSGARVALVQWEISKRRQIASDKASIQSLRLCTRPSSFALLSDRSRWRRRAQ